jgi:hypothetical protein
VTFACENSAIDLRGLSKRVTGSPHTSRAGDDNSLVAFLELIELRTQTTAEGSRKRVQAHLEFRTLEVGFHSSRPKSWRGHGANGNAGAGPHHGQRGRKAFDSLRYNPGRVVLESSSADLKVMFLSKSSWLAFLDVFWPFSHVLECTAGELQGPFADHFRVPIFLIPILEIFLFSS